MKVYVLYHGQCWDGFTAAWAAREKLKHLDLEVEYLAVSYGKPPPPMTPSSTVFIVDFSYPRDVLWSLGETHNVVVLDHHKTAAEQLAGLPIIKDFATTIKEFRTGTRAYFDMSRSGAAIAWDYFHGTEHYPTLVKYVQDRDLWKHALPDTENFNAFLRSFEFDFDKWSEINEHVEKYQRFSVFTAEGVGIQRQIQLEIKQMSRNALEVQSFLGRRAVVTNATTHFSEVCAHLLDKFPNAELAAVYGYARSGELIWSLRSRNTEDVDVSALALNLGGGGHKHAAGFKSKNPFFLSDLYSQLNQKEWAKVGRGEKVT